MHLLTPLPPSSHAKFPDVFPQATELEAYLKRKIRGEVRFDQGSRALYTTDASNYRQIPIGVVVPFDAEDTLTAVRACRDFGAPVLARGAGTSLAGQCCNVAVIFDFTKHMNRVVDLDTRGKVAVVEPGLVLDSLLRQSEPSSLTFAPDPSTHNRCTIGGMIGNNSCGTHSLLGGKTVDNVEELQIMLYDGTQMTVGPTSGRDLEQIISEGDRRAEIYGQLQNIAKGYSQLIRARFPRIPRRVSGYNLDELLPENGFNVARALVGSEGTCAIVLKAKIRLIDSPKHRLLLGLGYEDIFRAADQVPDILSFNPIALEGIEGTIVDGLRAIRTPHLDLLPDGRGILLVEFGSNDPIETQHSARDLINKIDKMACSPEVRIYNDTETHHVWRLRESGPRAAAFAPGAVPQWEGWEDAAVAPQKLGAYLRDTRRLMDEYGYQAALYGHFGHGCVHMRMSFDLLSEAGIRKYNEFVNQASDLVVSYGGSLSGEHGDGQSRGALLPKMFGAELMNAFREFKAAWDPDNKLNPNKLINAPPPTQDLRMGADYHPLLPHTRFSFKQDGGSFAKAAERCIGLGACRKKTGVMCPSYMVTLDEEHSTRGRAHMLFEMLQGQVIGEDWKNEQVKKSLDLCLSCKACKSECPANVDMATYKAEFLSHYYEFKKRPLQAYAFGGIDRWARLASFAPGVANFFSGAPGLRWAIGSALQLALQRPIPAFARRSFRQWARTNAGQLVRSGKSGSVVLWLDTFNNYFHPETIQAAVDVLHHAGFAITIPQKHLCCGRPLYDFGMIDRAKKYLVHIMRSLASEIDAGLPIVMLEPSCASVFRDELPNLFPRDARAQRLEEQTFLLSEFLEHQVAGYSPPPLSQRVLLHGHCHHKALMKFADEESLLRRMGVELFSPDSGCCGMAGPFGFDKGKFALSQAIGERVLLPAVRNSDSETIIVSDGFSCREQILQGTGRKAIHLAEVIQLALARDKLAPGISAKN